MVYVMCCRCPCTRGGRRWCLVSDACAFPPVCLVIIYEPWRNPILLSPTRSWTLGGRMVADSHTVLPGSPRHARPSPARAPRRRPTRNLPRATMARVLGSAEQAGGALTRRALRALRRRRTLRCRCRHRPLRPRALIPFPWREACPAWWGRDTKPRLPWPSAISRHIINRRASPIATSDTALSTAFIRWRRTPRRTFSSFMAASSASKTLDMAEVLVRARSLSRRVGHKHRSWCLLLRCGHTGRRSGTRPSHSRPRRLLQRRARA